jgi:cation transport ATPase
VTAVEHQDAEARDDRSEEEQERLNRQMIELLNEVRVATAGVQVLFGFLLAVPFQQRFTQVDDFQRKIYFVTLLAAAAATALLIAPSAYHRVAFQQHDKPRIIRLGSRQFIAGLVALTIAMTGAVTLVTDFLFAASTTIITAIAVLVGFGWLWFGIGLWRRTRTRP